MGIGESNDKTRLITEFTFHKTAIWSLDSQEVVLNVFVLSAIQFVGYSCQGRMLKQMILQLLRGLGMERTEGAKMILL
jgi:hypothetical protein